MSALFNRGTGLIIIDVVNSNPNGDPDGESEPRTFEGDGRGLISPVSFKRKLRDLMFNPRTKLSTGRRVIRSRQAKSARQRWPQSERLA